MAASDRDKVVAFAKKPSEDDLLYLAFLDLRSATTDRAVVDARVENIVENIKGGSTVSLSVKGEDEIVDDASV